MNVNSCFHGRIEASADRTGTRSGAHRAGRERALGARGSWGPSSNFDWSFWECSRSFGVIPTVTPAHVDGKGSWKGACCIEQPASLFQPGAPIPASNAAALLNIFAGSRSGVTRRDQLGSECLTPKQCPAAQAGRLGSRGLNAEDREYARSLGRNVICLLSAYP